MFEASSKEYYSVDVMGREIDKTVKPVVVDSPWHPGKQFTLTGRDARIAGPERVAMSHNKNSTPLGESHGHIFKQLTPA